MKGPAMKKDEIKIGQCYEAKVSDRIVSVRIDSSNSHGGWNATNTATGKRIRIKSAQRLRRAVPTGRKAAKQADATPEPEVNPTVEVITGQPLPEGDCVKAAKPRRPKKAAGEPKPKRVSALDAAAQVLADSDQPLRAKEMIEAMAERGLWSSPNGKTPEATLYAAILREISTKGSEARFRKVERGQFTHTGVAGN
ncbi:MAG: winged helix-turn-helix domain-containing protein [Planctomycetota bacterium]